VTLFTINGSNQPARVITAGDGPGVLVNRDITNQCYIAPIQAFDPGDVTASILDPLVGIPFDGDSDEYATVAAGISITVDYIQNGENWTPSPEQAAQQIASLGLATHAEQVVQETSIPTNISTTGVPLLAAPLVQSASGTPVNIPAVASNQVITFTPGGTVIPVGGNISYEASLRANSNAASTVPFLIWTFAWYADAAATILLYQEKWIVANNSVSGGTSVNATGPCRGAFLKVTVTNLDATNAQTLNGMHIVLSSRPSPTQQPDWRTNDPTLSIPNYVAPNANDVTDGVLGYFTGTLAAGLQTNLICGLFNGLVQINYLSITPASASILATPANMTPGGSALQNYNGVTFATPTNQQQSVYNPRSNLIINIDNGSAVTITYFIAVLAARQQT
jgi:hypothetical protein